MDSAPRKDLFYGLFELWPPKTVPDPQTGRPLKVASVELSERSVCPACTQLGAGGYVSFVADLRLAFACPSCRKLIWISGA